MTPPDVGAHSSTYEDPLTEQVNTVLPLACFGVAAVYFLMHAAALVAPPAWNQDLLNVTGLGFAAACFALGMYVRNRQLSGERPHWVMMFLGVGMTAHATLVMHLLDGATHTLNLALIAVSMGFFFSKRAWFYLGITLVLTGWLSAYATSTQSASEWRLWGGAMMIAVALAITLFEARRRTMLQLHGLRLESRAVHQREVQMQSMMQEAQRRESLGILAGGIAHDFNNLLTVVRGNTELALARAGTDKTMLALLSDVDKAATKAGELTQLMLVYAGRSRPVISRFDFSERISGNVDLVESSLPRGVSVVRTGKLDGQQLEADTTLIDQIVLNLVHNAADACAERGGKITVGWGVQEVTDDDLRTHPYAVVPSPGLHAYIRVHDDGVGIEQDDQARVFEPFYSTKFDGNGLGLAAVRGIVEGHGGGLLLTSARGVGTTFEVFLPVAEHLLSSSTRQAAEHPLAEAQASVSASAVPMLLVVDDQPAVRLIARRMLDDAGYQVVEAGSGRAAVELVDGGLHVDLALIDLTMPEGDGLQTIEQLRQRAPELPVVLMSGFDINEVLSQERDKPKDLFYIDKPFSQQQLTSLVREMLQR